MGIAYKEYIFIMTIVELKSHIMKSELNNFYIFVGDEIGIMNIYLEQISKKMQLQIVRADSVVSIYGRCTSKSIFGDIDSLYVIRNDTDIQKHEELYTRISSEIRNNIIILLYDKIDSRLKFGKYFKDSIVYFEPLSTQILCNYIRQRYDISERNAEKLSNIVHNSYDLSMLEMDKVKQYSDSKGLNDLDKSFNILLDRGVIFKQEDDDVFEFAELVMRKSMRQAFKMLNNMIDNGVSSVTILGVLYLKVKGVLLVQVCEYKDVENTTGLSKGEIYFPKKNVGNYSSGQLVRSMKLIEQTVNDIKNGLIDDTIATHYVLVQMV